MKIFRRFVTIRRRRGSVASDADSLARFLREGPNDRARGMDHLRGCQRSLNGW